MAASRAPEDLALERGLPANLDAERYCLGTVLLDDSKFTDIAALISPDDFSLESHRRIFLRMSDVTARGERIDRVTVANELKKHRQLESIGGLSYLVSLDDGLPSLANFSDYARIVREKSKLRKIIFSSRNAINRALEDALPAEDIASESAQQLVALSERKDKSGPQSAYSIIEEDPNKFFESTVENSDGLKTGFTRLDGMMGGLQKQDLIIVAGRPGMGKTAIGLNMAAHIAIREMQGVGIWSIEMTKKQLLMRLVCSEARVDIQKFRQGYMNADERMRCVRAANALKEVPLNIDDRKGLNIVEIHAAARKLQQKNGLSLVVIDYLQILTQHTKTDNRARAIGEITKYIKTAICPDLDVPVMLLSQINRENTKRSGGDHRPRLSDLKESGSIEEDADVVAFCHREEYYHKDREDLKGQGELILEKHRNGPTGTVKLVFLKEFTRWDNRARDTEEEEV